MSGRGTNFFPNLFTLPVGDLTVVFIGSVGTVRDTIADEHARDAVRNAGEAAYRARPAGAFVFIGPVLALFDTIASQRPADAAP